MTLECYLVTRPRLSTQQPWYYCKHSVPEGVASAVIGTSGKRGPANPNQMAPLPVTLVYINEDPEAGTAARDIYKLSACVCVWVNRPTDS